MHAHAGPLHRLFSRGVADQHSHPAIPPSDVRQVDTNGVLMALLLPRSRFGMFAGAGAHQAFLGVHRVCWRPNSVATQLVQL
jgi:hypothetical protein